MRPRTVLRGAAIVLSAAVALLGLDRRRRTGGTAPRLGGYQGTRRLVGPQRLLPPAGRAPHRDAAST